MTKQTDHTPGLACGQCNALRAERDKLRAALTDIAERGESVKPGMYSRQLAAIARAALQDTQS